MRRLSAVAVVLSALASSSQAQELTEKSFAKWRDFVLPSAESLRIAAS